MRILVAVMIIVPLVSCQSLEKERASIELETNKAIGLNQLNSGENDNALQLARSMLASYPDDPDLHTIIGLVHLTYKNPERASLHLRTAYRLLPNAPNALNLSSALLEDHRYVDALQILNPWVNGKMPSDYQFPERLYHNAGTAIAGLGFWRSAEVYFQRGLADNPTFFLSNLLLARLYQTVGRSGDAAMYYTKSMIYCRTCIEPVQGLASMYLGLGQTQKATAAVGRFGRTEGLSPDDRKRAAALLEQVKTAKELPIPKF